MSDGRRKQNGPLGRWKYIFPRVPLLIAGTYAIVSALWIAFSDRALSGIAGGYAHYQSLQTYKGWAFVAVSALLIFFLQKAAWRGILAAYETSSQAERRLECLDAADLLRHSAGIHSHIMIRQQFALGHLDPAQLDDIRIGLELDIVADADGRHHQAEFESALAADHHDPVQQIAALTHVHHRNKTIAYLQLHRVDRQQ